MLYVSKLTRPGQLSGTRAAASAMAVEAGALPDAGVPVIPLETHQDTLWVDEDDEDDVPTGISHAGGEITDQARRWFERATRKYVFP